jgi:hypothetical protein
LRIFFKAGRRNVAVRAVTELRIVAKLRIVRVLVVGVERHERLVVAIHRGLEVLRNKRLRLLFLGVLGL